jgi:uncharacterized protein with beta-barrel porin domain
MLVPRQELRVCPRSRDAVALVTGLSFFTDGAFSAGLNYDLKMGNSSQSSMVQARLNWNF